MPKVLISDSLSNLAKKIFEKNSIEVDINTELSPSQLQETIWSKVKIKLQEVYGEEEYSNWLKLLSNLDINSSSSEVNSKKSALDI